MRGAGGCICGSKIQPQCGPATLRVLDGLARASRGPPQLTPMATPTEHQDLAAPAEGPAAAPGAQAAVADGPAQAALEVAPAVGQPSAWRAPAPTGLAVLAVGTAAEVERPWTAAGDSPLVAQAAPTIAEPARTTPLGAAPVQGP
jgi:hypothetical protein